MSGQRYPSLAAFYGERGGERSGERDFGVWWSDGATRWPHYRVSVVHDTGDVYAIRLGGTAEVELLGTVDHVRLCADLPAHDVELCAYPVAERVLDGWGDHVIEAGSLQWVRERLAAVLA